MFGPLIVRPNPTGVGLPEPCKEGPKDTKGDKTGSWRIKLRPQFLQKNCVGCRMCALLCPEGCITGKEKNTYSCDYNYCKGCGLCASLCPKDDILMVEEP